MYRKIVRISYKNDDDISIYVDIKIKKALINTQLPVYSRIYIQSTFDTYTLVKNK